VIVNLDVHSLDLSGMDALFSEREVWAAITDMPADRALGPDCFTGAFYRSAWPIIKTDIMWAINSFTSSTRRSFRCLNNAFIVLLPKTDAPVAANDYRPITLIHSFAKLVSKLMANRLAPSLPRLVGINQSAFIKGRYILDNYKYVQRAAVLFRKRKISKILLKVDISKAFDTLSWPFLIEILHARGFSNRWCEWISIFMSTATSRVLLNRCPGKPIQHRRGVRQGDPLSPMLFIVAMDMMNRIFRAAVNTCVLEQGIHAAQRHISLYADDAIIFASPTRREGRAIAWLLDIFGGASGLRTNISKCSITPIFGDDDGVLEFQQELPCQIQQFPIKYLGVPLSTDPLPRGAVRPIVNKVAAKLVPWHGSLMSKSGRLIVVKSVASAVPIYTIMANDLPAWAADEIDPLRRNFFWAGGDEST
jgi:hypothetical protein